MFWLHRGGPGPIHSPLAVFDGVDRVNFMYLSTFTRSSGLLLGAAAAFVWRPWRTVDDTPERPAANLPALDAAGAAAVAGLGVIAASAVLVEGYVYQWLLPMVSILSAIAVMARRPPGRHVVPRGAGVAAARRGRQAQLRPLPVELADLRAVRGHPRLGAAGGRGADDHRGAVRAVLPVRRDAGATRRARAVVARRRPGASDAGRWRSPGALVAVLAGFYAVGPPVRPGRRRRRPVSSRLPHNDAVRGAAPPSRRRRGGRADAPPPAPGARVPGRSSATPPPTPWPINEPDGIEDTFDITERCR